MNMNETIKKINEQEEIIKAIIKMGVFAEAAHEIGLSQEEISDMIKYIARKRELKKNGKDI